MEEMEAIFQQAKKEQDNAVKQSKDQQQQNVLNGSVDSIKSATKTKPSNSKKGSRYSESSLVHLEDHKSLAPGSNVRILSGPFSEFTGCIKEVNLGSGKVCACVDDYMSTLNLPYQVNCLFHYDLNKSKIS